MPGRIAFKAIPRIAAIASDVNVIDVPATVKVIPSPNPSPLTRITAATIRLRDFVKSTLFSTTLRTPIAEIIPYSMKLTPPMIDAGSEPIHSATFGEKLRRIAYTAARRTTLGSYTRLSSRTPVFSPYVVFAGPPNAAANAVARPSPIRVL